HRFGEIQVHVLAAKAGRRPERSELAPVPAGQAALLAQLTLRGRERVLPPLARAGRQLDEVPARGLAKLPHEPQLVPGVGGDVDELPVVDDAGLVGLHSASRSTSLRSSGPNQGGSPAAAFSAVRSGRDVAGIATSTRSSESTHFRSACAQVRMPNSRSGASSSSLGARRTSAPSPSGRMTITAIPSSAASGRSSRSTSRSSGLYGSWITSKRPVRSARASSGNACG